MFFVINTKDRKGNSDTYNADGSIITGNIPSWRQINQSYRNIVMEKCNQLNIGKRRKGGNKPGSSNLRKSNSNRMNQVTAQNKKMKSQIKALKQKKNFREINKDN